MQILTSLFQRHLLATNLSLSFLLSGFGDFLQQKYEGRKHGCNFRRTLHMSTTYGLTAGFLCHFWYNYLDKAIPGSGIRVVVRKIFYDQVFFSPGCIAACLVVDGVIEGISSRQLAYNVWDKGRQLYLAEWVLWPPAQFINFYFLPTRYRVVFDNLVSLAYDFYTSHVKHQRPPRHLLFEIEEDLVQKKS